MVCHLLLMNYHSVIFGMRSYVKWQTKTPCYDPEYMYKAYGYLMLEELHPLYFPVELENPELLPDDLEYLYEQEESA